MRILNRASVAFFIVNDYSKGAISNARIMCNNSYIPYSNKGDGYYSFSNLENGMYKFDIMCDGFKPASYEVKVSDIQPIQIVSCLKYSSDSTDLYNINKIVFYIKNDGKPLENTDIKIKLDTKVLFLKLIDPIEKNSNVININSDFDKRLLYQDYAYDKRQTMVINLNGYDHINKVYQNSKVYKSKVAEGGYLTPLWKFTTDDFGRVILPINPVFFAKPQAELTLTILKKKYSVRINTNDTENIEIDISKGEIKGGI